MLAAFAVLALLASDQAPAGDVPNVATVTVEGQKAVADKPVCRTERSLSTRVIKRICKTTAERKQEELEARTKIRMGSGRKGETTEAFKRPEAN